MHPSGVPCLELYLSTEKPNVHASGPPGQEIFAYPHSRFNTRADLGRAPDFQAPPSPHPLDARQWVSLLPR